MSFRFTTIDEPNADQNFLDGTAVQDINNTGVVVGDYGNNGNRFGFYELLGIFTTLFGPAGASNVTANGVNASGQIVGSYDDINGNPGSYIYSGGTYTTLAADNLTAINDAGIVVGWRFLNGGTIQGFRYIGGGNAGFIDVAVPGANYTLPFGINNAGDIVGEFSDNSPSHFHGFLDHNGTYTVLDDPLATNGTWATGINNQGQIVGKYVDGSGTHSYLYSGGVYATLADPDGTATAVNAINDHGVIGGVYSDAAGVHGFVASRATPHDFYGAGTASVLWRNGSGLASWDMFGSSPGSSIFSSGAITYQGQPLNPDASWSVAGIADFNADGEADVLWRQTGGPLALWQMSGATAASSNLVTYNGGVIAPDASWNVAAVADFNADSEADILWRQGAGGALSLWSMNRSKVTASSAVTLNGNAITPDASWSVGGVGDFNGDGSSDLLWRQSSGALSLWDMHGSQIVSSATVTFQGSAIAPDASWSIAGVGDFNGDGHADVLWRQSNGTIALWLMNDGSVTSSSAITYQGNAQTPDASWKIVEVADFNGDGHTDILWRNDNGAMAEWLMNGSQVTASVTPGFQGNAVSPDGGWSVQGKATMFA
jgi:hypothetical protein